MTLPLVRILDKLEHADMIVSEAQRELPGSHATRPTLLSIRTQLRLVIGALEIANECRAKETSTSRYCVLPKGHDGNHRSGATEWGR